MSADKNHRGFIPDDPKIKIWRYMDFAKFASMLENGGVYFPRGDKLGDPFEGSTPRGNEKLRQNYKPAIKWEDFEIMYKRSLKQSMINCWHMNEYESAAMWGLYTKTNEAIAIQPTYELLDQCFDQFVNITTVKYIDYNTDSIPEGNTLTLLAHKRKSFEHEREIRAIMLTPNLACGDDVDALPSTGEWKEVDLNKLIEKVYVAPSAPSWFKKLVSGILNKYGLNKPVFKSALDEEPFY